MSGFMGFQNISLAQGAAIFQLAHNLTGFLELIAVLFAMAASFCIKQRRVLRIIWASLLVFTSVVMFIYITFAFGGGNVARVLFVSMRSNELLEHFCVFLTLLVGSLAVLLQLTGLLRHKQWQQLMAVCLLVAGFVFVLHPQAQILHEARGYSLAMHRLFGVLMMLTGLFFSLDVFLAHKTRAFEFIWLFFWFCFAFALMLYRVDASSFVSFAITTMFQPGAIASFGIAAAFTMLILLIMGLLFERKAAQK